MKIIRRIIILINSIININILNLIWKTSGYFSIKFLNSIIMNNITIRIISSSFVKYWFISLSFFFFTCCWVSICRFFFIISCFCFFNDIFCIIKSYRCYTYQIYFGAYLQPVINIFIKIIYIDRNHVIDIFISKIINTNINT